VRELNDPSLHFAFGAQWMTVCALVVVELTASKAAGVNHFKLQIPQGECTDITS